MSVTVTKSSQPLSKQKNYVCVTSKKIPCVEINKLIEELRPQVWVIRLQIFLQ